jgi:glycerol-3-phosphate dehydrogenase
MISRKDAIAQIQSNEFDLVVIGGGATGAMVALDAASRGMSVVLLERDDYSQGTSSRSSKMIHGGLRYLENFDVGLVREALLERSLMVELAPHQVYPTPYLVPRLGDDGRDIALGVGLNAYDALATVGVKSDEGPGETAENETLAAAVDRTISWAPERHRTIDGAEAARMMPALAPLNPQSAYLFYDCQTDDSRLVITALQEAERYGAVLLNGADVVEVLDQRGKASGVAFVEQESGDRVEVSAANVVNATGVWADQIRPDGIEDEGEVPLISPSRGTHITLSLDDLPVGEAACIVPAGEGRRIFALPWYGRALVGTTDNEYDGDIDSVSPSQSDVEYLLDAVNTYFETDIAPEQVTGAFAGVRPLISSGDTKKSVDISRKAEMYETSSGMLTITGGKYTTWRRMGKQVVDRIVEREGLSAACRTAEIPLGLPARPEDLETDLDLPDGAIEQLAFRYGHGAREVLDLCAERPELAQPILEGFPDLLAEVVIATRNEQARKVSDVILRRTRLGLLAARDLDSAESVAEVADLMGEELGWSKKRRAEEATLWVDEARREGINPLIRAGR